MSTSASTATKLQLDLRLIPNRELLDQYAVLAMMPSGMAGDTAALLAAIRSELLSRLERVA